MHVVDTGLDVAHPEFSGRVGESLGGPVAPALDLAVCNSVRGDVAYAVAAGNDGADACDGSPNLLLYARDR